MNLYSSSGIFFIKDAIDSIITLSERLEEITQKKNIKNSHEFKRFIDQSEMDIYGGLLDDKNLKRVFIKKTLPLFFEHKKKFRKVINSHRFFSKLLSTFFELKIFNLNIIKNIVKNEEIISTLFAGKRKKLSKLHKKYKIEDITIKKIRNIIDSFLETKPPLIQPSLISTITTTNFAGYNLFIILENNSNVQNKIENLKFLFPRCLVIQGKDLMSGNELIYLDIFMPNLSISEKETLFSILKDTFGKDINQTFRLNSHGIINTFSLKDYYDFENKCYFYTKDLFSQFKLYMNSILSSSSQITLPKKNTHISLFKLNSEKLNLDDMARITLKNKSRRNLNFKPQKVHYLEEFHNGLYDYLQNRDRFKEITREEFYDLYIQSIKFVPQFQHFGFSKYLFWYKPRDISTIRLKTLLTNTFLNVRTPTEINSIVPSFLISYLFPFRTPNKSYINWLLKTKNQFIEYFLISITQVHHILQFNKNLTTTGWDLKAERFLSFAKNLVLNNTTEMDRSFVKRYSLETTSDKVYGKHSMEYNSLKDLFTYEPMDLKSFLGRENYSKLESFKVLNSKDLLFPYLEIKNLGFQEILYIFIPKVSTKKLNTLVDIFSFFNYCFLYEVEGEYLIDGMYDTKACQKGIFIELHLPDCAIHEIYNAFHEIFSLLGLIDYALFYELVSGKELLRKVFGNIRFLNNYTPLNNLEWNKKDKIWMNVQLIDEKFRFLPFDL